MKIKTSIWNIIQSDYKAVIENDPAFPGGIRGFLEVILCYPGFHAVIAHRLFHFMHKGLGIPVLPRLLSQLTRWWTGIEIHPGASLGKGVFIDHGMGVVIGETAIVEDHVILYQGVTLGGTGKDQGKRHPTVKKGVLIGCGAKILGNIVIGENSKVGAGSVVIKDVPPGSTVVGVPAVAVRNKFSVSELLEASPLSHGDLPEPVLSRLAHLEKELHDIQEIIARLSGLGETREVA